AGISTNAMLRALGFTLGIFVCLLISLSAYEVHKSLRNDKEKNIFLFLSVLIFALEYCAAAVAALQRLKILRTSDAIFNISVFDVMIWRGANPNAFLYAQLILALLMLLFVIKTHMKPSGEFANKALLRKEKARLRDCRRWSWSLAAWGAMAIFIVIVLHYYDTKPPAEVQPEPYEISDGIISIELSKVSDGHLHKFSYITPNKFDVRFLVVKKPAGSAYGVGLDACDICGIAGYYERGNDEVVCRRCDVVMNKNTIGFKGGCNPVPFEYEIKSGKIFIDVKELIKEEGRFK
ncbi:MAG: Fe-S-containing protein, partial [Synergistales bacterium]|nr:Fe-S-containing protein [Synergistales bacterium]